MQIHCDPQRLQLLLDDSLTGQFEAEIGEHLAACENCRASLEAMAAGKEIWTQASDLLRIDPADPIDSSWTAYRGVTPAELAASDETYAADFAVHFLDPSDDPGMLGTLGEYEVLEVVGRGGMSVVLKGYQRELNRYVAVKMLAPHLAGSAAA